MVVNVELLFIAILTLFPVVLIAAGYVVIRSGRIALRPIGVGLLAAGGALAGWIVLFWLSSVWTQAEQQTGFPIPPPILRNHQGTPVQNRAGMSDGESCWYADHTYIGRSMFGIRLWSYYQRVEWCGDGTLIVGNLKQSRAWDTHVPFWTFGGHLDFSEGGGAGEDRYSAFSQGKFKFCTFPRAVCIEEDNPWIHMTVFGDGTFGSASSGGR